MALSEGDEIKGAVRRLRKKLRQISALERLQRSLSPEERVKVESRAELQDSLARFLALAEQFNVSAMSEEQLPEEQRTTAEESVNNALRNSPVSVSMRQLVEREDDLNNEPSVEVTIPSATENTPQPTVQTTTQRSVTPPPTRQPKSLSAGWEELPTPHSDLLLSVTRTPGYLATAGRDRCTALLSADPPYPLLHTLGEHTDTVTAVLAIPPGVGSILTTSLDCSVKVWGEQGALLHSTYLYSPLTCAAVSGGRVLLGTAGGKVMCYSLERREVEWEAVVHDEAVATVAISGTHAFSASYNLVVWDLRTQGRISETEGARRIVSSSLHGQDTLYFCSRGASVKAWTGGRVRSVFRNSLSRFNSTDCVRVAGELLLASVYDLDRGISSINVWNLDRSVYVCTVVAPVTCITCMHVTVSRGTIIALVGGTSVAQLTLKETDRFSGVTLENGLRPYTKEECSELDSESDVDSRSDFTSSESDDGTSSEPSQGEQSSYYWCSLL